MDESPHVPRPSSGRPQGGDASDAFVGTDQSPSGPPAGHQGPPAAAQPVTRFLCATAHLRAAFADHVVGALLRPGFTAVAPSWGVDLVALARHGDQSKTRRLERDRQLRWCFAGMVLTALAALLLGLPLGLGVMATLVLVILVLCAGWALAWVIVVRHYWQVRASSLRVLTDKATDPRDLAPTVDQYYEGRLEELATANVVLFSGYLPFVGNGLNLDSWTMALDVDRGARRPDGSTATPRPFDAVDVHDHLLRTVPLGPVKDVKASKRLFVAGPAARDVPGLVVSPPDPHHRPACRLPEAMLDEYTRTPAVFARSYVCFEKTGWGGEVVVSLLVRAERVGRTLFVEGRSQVLLPLQSVYHDVEGIALKSGYHAWIPVLRSATVATHGLFVESFPRHIRRILTTRINNRKMELLRQDIVRGYPMDYGAPGSIRELAADVEELPYYATVDEVMYFHTLKRQVLSCIQDFLEEKEVDLGDFRRQQRMLISQTNIHLHNVQGSAANFGKNVTVSGITPIGNG
ncbi:MAG: hypothetical protein GXX79_20095 [Actinomycetales bacterium]|nr:hypothetical protein [Actinomycetales bacterium]